MPGKQLDAMIVLLGATGYVGQAFARALLQRGWSFAALTRKEVNYTRFEVLLEHLRSSRPSFLINAAGHTGRPNVDACETALAETLAGNTLLAQTVAHACFVAHIPFGHVSSGCIYSGAKIADAGRMRIEKDLMRLELQAARSIPGAIRGFTEADLPNFSFRSPPCSFYSGTKALAEEAIGQTGSCCYLWRLRLPFNEVDNPRNFLTKVQRYPKVYDNINSLSHLDDFVRAALDLWEGRAPFGTYNMTNPGYVTTRQVVEMIERIRGVRREFHFWVDDEEFYRSGAQAPRSNCVLDVSKLLATGVPMRPVEEALENALRNWRSGGVAEAVAGWESGG